MTPWRERVARRQLEIAQAGGSDILVGTFQEEYQYFLNLAPSSEKLQIAYMLCEPLTLPVVDSLAHLIPHLHPRSLDLSRFFLLPTYRTIQLSKMPRRHMAEFRARIVSGAKRIARQRRLRIFSGIVGPKWAAISMLPERPAQLVESYFGPSWHSPRCWCATMSV